MGSRTMKNILTPIIFLAIGLLLGFRMQKLRVPQEQPNHSVHSVSVSTTPQFALPYVASDMSILKSDFVPQELGVLGSRLATANYKAGLVYHLILKGKRSFRSGLYQNIVIEEDLPICGKHFVDAYNSETRRLLTHRLPEAD